MQIDWQSLSKPERIQTFQHMETKDEVPKSYSQNTIKESLILQYVNMFQKQFHSLYPTKEPLFLTPRNEQNTPKFISTSIKLSRLNYDELYEAETCARFVWCFVTYEPLLEPTVFPSVVVSPTTTLMWQKGDCFDISILLVSLLIGSGYDAYCVCGHAAKKLTENLQLLRKYPVDKIQKEFEDEEKAETGKKKSKYRLKGKLSLTSTFDAQKDSKDEKVIHKQVEDDDTAADDDDLKGKRIHCWVLVLPGSRDVEKPFFLEPSTGERHEIDDPHYHSITSLWNNENYWVNMQEEVEGVANLDYDLNNLNAWEYIFIKEPSDDDENEDDQKADAVGVQPGEFNDEILDLPVSWVNHLSISKEQFSNRYPGKEKHIEYANADLSLYSQYSRDDCLVENLTVFIDNEKTQPKEIHCFFKHRKDLLTRRSLYYIPEESGIRVRKHQWFLPGRRNGTKIEALKEVIEEKGIQNVYKFYSEARADGLDTRTETFHPKYPNTPKKIILTFKGRDNRLCYRSVTYDVEIPSKPMDSSSYVPIDERKIVKMTEKFERNPDIDANLDVAKRIFYLADAKIKLLFHYGPGKITHSVREYNKQGDFSIDIVDPFMKRPKLSQTLAEYKSLLAAEQNCEAKIRFANSEIKSIILAREKEEMKVEKITSIYDTRLNQPTQDELDEMARLERERMEKLKTKDILGNLAPKDGIKSEEMAKEIFQKVLGKLRERLLARTKIMEERLASERNQMNRKRKAYQKSQDTGEAKEEEFVEFWEKTMFRMSILRKRVEQNKIDAKKEFAKLQEDLLMDERLKPFLKKERAKFFGLKAKHS